MELLKHEIYKIFSRKIVLVGLIVFIPVYLIYTFGMNVSYLSNYREAYGYYKSFEGKLDSSKADKITEGMRENEELYKKGVKLDSKQLAMKILYSDMTNLVQDKDSLQNKKIKLENELKKYTAKDYEYKKTRMELTNIEKIKALTGLYYKEGWKAVINFNHDIGYWFVLIFSLLGISGIISQEYSDGMNTLIRSTKNGKRNIVIAKTGAVFIFILAITSFVAILNLMTNAYFYSLSGSNVSIRNIYELFLDSSKNINIWQFYMISQIFMILGVLVICLVFIFLSIFIRNSGIPFIIILAVFSLSDIIARSKINLQIMGLLPSEFLRLDNLYKDYRFIYNIFGQPVEYEKLLLSVDILAVLILIGVIIKSFERFGLREYK